jgi:hypothetical protein
LFQFEEEFSAESVDHISRVRIPHFRLFLSEMTAVVSQWRLIVIVSHLVEDDVMTVERLGADLEGFDELHFVEVVQVSLLDVFWKEVRQ